MISIRILRNVLLSIPLIVFSELQAQGLSPSTLLDLIGKQNSAEDSKLLINSLSEKGHIPLTFEDSCLFVYLGKAESVKWNGDFNQWGGDGSFQNSGTEIAEGLWILKSSFPPDARLDYKIVVDGNWILDPLNPNQQWTGLGGGSPNSEIRMTDWTPEPYTIKRENIESGKLKDYQIESTNLEHRADIRIYYPVTFNSEMPHPVIYFTDGNEYAHDRIGDVPTILDNLIHDGKIPPSVAVFYDPRDPDHQETNYRMSECALNEKFLEFFLSNLVPFIEDSLNIKVIENGRAIVGTSLGGLNAAYFGFSKPEYFPLLGIQSPAFQYKPEIYDLISDTDPTVPLRIYMSTGVINDTEKPARKMKDILETKGYVLKYQEVNEGHSWGNWRALIDDMLIFLLADHIE